MIGYPFHPFGKHWVHHHQVQVVSCRMCYCPSCWGWDEEWKDQTAEMAWEECLQAGHTLLQWYTTICPCVLATCDASAVPLVWKYFLWAYCAILNGFESIGIAWLEGYIPKWSWLIVKDSSTEGFQWKTCYDHPVKTVDMRYLRSPSFQTRSALRLRPP